MIKIAPSLLSADFARMGEEIRALDAAGADWLHVDVMDGHFVPNLTFGPPLIKAWRAHSQTPFDVHLMTTNAESTYHTYLEAGADILTFHHEAVDDAAALIHAIQARGAKAGISIKPATDVCVLEPLIPFLDHVLIMTVEPGFGGQAFLPENLEKVRSVRQWADAHNPALTLAVDGGIVPETWAQARAAGATVAVSGSGVFKGGAYAENMAALRRAAPL